MEDKEAPGASSDEIVDGREFSAQLDSGKPRVESIGSGVLLGGISRIVAEYSSDGNSDYTVAALSGAQPISLCLSQDVNSPLGSCWSLGFLPAEHQWNSLDIKVDKEFLITDQKGCLFFLNEKSSQYCRIVIEVLVLKLNMAASDTPSALDDLRNTLGALQSHLTSVKHVVVSITEYASCCFSFKDTIHKVTGLPQPFDHQLVLLEIIDDVDICWKKDHTRIAIELFEYYFKGDAKRASDMYLAKFVISVNHPVSQTLFRQEAPNRLSNKIMWVCLVKSDDDATHVDQDTLRLCHAFYFDGSHLEPDVFEQLRDRLEATFAFEDNPFLERCIICFHHDLHYMQLPLPSAPLTDVTVLSALIELTLDGEVGYMNLGEEINNNYFQNLTHLSVIGKSSINGHLDSHCVPRLRTLILESKDMLDHLGTNRCRVLRERVQSLIRAGHPWQFVAATTFGGWSLASYEDAKENSPSSLPLIKELLLVAINDWIYGEWYSKLSGNPPLEASAKNHNDRLLVWAPQCVHKITAFGKTKSDGVAFPFDEAKSGQTPILSSLTCYGVPFVLDGAVFPHLQSLEITETCVWLSGAFPHLQTLSFRGALLKTPWHIDAPLLQFLSCLSMRKGARLSLNPQLLSRLSFLHIAPRSFEKKSYPNIVNVDSDLGLSPIKHIVFDKGMTMSPFFEQYRVNGVSHLELAVDAFQLPACWFTAVWQCETLKLVVEVSSPEHIHPPNNVVLPMMPLVKTLTIAASSDPVLVNAEMPNLTECTVRSPQSLGPKLKCPALKRIRFTDQLSESDKKQCMDPTTYFNIGAQPRDVIFAFDHQLHTMAWNIVQSESPVLSLDEPLEEVD